MKNIKRILFKCRKAEDGTAVLEFAFSAPIIILAAIGLIECAMMMFVSSLVEGGLREA